MGHGSAQNAQPTTSASQDGLLLLNVQLISQFLQQDHIKKQIALLQVPLQVLVKLEKSWLLDQLLVDHGYALVALQTTIANEDGLFQLNALLQHQFLLKAHIFRVLAKVQTQQLRQLNAELEKSELLESFLELGPAKYALAIIIACRQQINHINALLLVHIHH
jgi:hypothetical protein